MSKNTEVSETGTTKIMKIVLIVAFVLAIALGVLSFALDGDTTSTGTTTSTTTQSPF